VSGQLHVRGALSTEKLGRWGPKPAWTLWSKEKAVAPVGESNPGRAHRHTDAVIKRRVKKGRRRMQSLPLTELVHWLLSFCSLEENVKQASLWPMLQTQRPLFIQLISSTLQPTRVPQKTDVLMTYKHTPLTAPRHEEGGSKN
jgi:hypothetical protein